MAGGDNNDPDNGSKDKIDEMMIEPHTDEIVKYIIDSDQLLDKLNIFF